MKFKIKIKWLLIALILVLLLTSFSFSGAISFFKWFVDLTGYLGLFIVVFVLDVIFVQPISPTIFTVIVLLGGLDYIPVLLISSAASVLAGILGYKLGNKYGLAFLEKHTNPKKLAKAQAFFNKYSTWGIILGSATVVPFSIACWLAGIAKVDFKKFVIISVIARFLGFAIVVAATYFGIDIFTNLAV